MPVKVIITGNECNGCKHQILYSVRCRISDKVIKWLKSEKLIYSGECPFKENKGYKS